ncbi:CYFA0S03e03312g1_1 [Cyberlindnera fabianii]|uniref:CYFA0S03e03312g1_1 n=1 Tax=Cyberlindnera fabianii TaxID=36022 RepID=A0A061AQK6_CYBFA|nr:CYFA0S03e03312g1_1 [Cyberlindnera fabianii]
MHKKLREDLSLQPSHSTPSLPSLNTTPSPAAPIPSRLLSPTSATRGSRLFEYEDIIQRKTSPQPHYKLTDILARESDATVSSITPLTEYKGYGTYILVSLIHLVWLAWTLTPKTWLNAAGIYYYPSRWWSLSISSLVLMAMLYTYVALQLWNIEIETIQMDALNAIVDEDAVIEPDVNKYGWRDTNGVYDLRIGEVNRVLYGE